MYESSGDVRKLQSDSVGLGQSLRVCIPNEVSGKAHIALRGPHFEQQGPRSPSALLSPVRSPHNSTLPGKPLGTSVQHNHLISMYTVFALYENKTEDKKDHRGLTKSPRVYFRSACLKKNSSDTDDLHEARPCQEEDLKPNPSDPILLQPHPSHSCYSGQIRWYLRQPQVISVGDR